MSDQCRTTGSGNPGVSAETRKESSSSVADKSGKPEKTERRTSRRYPDMQSAVRFPIKLPISVKSKSGDSATQTQNISANGVLLQEDAEMPVGSMVDFTISLPVEVGRADGDVQLDCRG